MHRPIPLLLLGLVALSTTGCIAVAAGAAAGYGAYKVSSNGESRSYRAPLATTWSATLATMRESGYPIADSAPLGPAGGRVSSNDATVDVDRESEETTRVSVRFGTFDTASHRARADAILDGVARRLGAKP